MAFFNNAVSESFWNLNALLGEGVRQWEKQKYALDRKGLSFRFSYILWAQNRFQIENRVKTRKNPGVFRKFFPIENLFFENFQNDRRDFSNISFNR